MKTDNIEEPLFEAVLREHPDALSEEGWPTMPPPAFEGLSAGEELRAQA